MKSEIRSSVIFEVGERLEDVLEASKMEIGRAEGRISAFGQAAKVPLRLTDVVKQELDAEAISLEQADLINKWLLRAATQIENLEKTAGLEKVAAAGKQAGLKAAVEVTKGLFDREQAKTQAVEQIARGERPDTHRPTIKAQRLADKQTQSAVESEAEPKPKKKTRRAKRAQNT